MGIRTGAEYIEGLRKRPREVWVAGEKITNVVDHPYFRQPIKEIAKLYDMQHDPKYQDKITHICEETGERVSNAFLVPRSVEDLRAKKTLYEIWAKATFGLMGRTPDFLNTVVTSMASNSWFFEQYDSQWAENIKNYYKYLRDNDLFLTHALVNPQNDRSNPSSQQQDKYTHLGVVEETSEGLIVRGAKMLATLAPITDEVIVYPFPYSSKPGDERYSLAFAIPIDAPGLKIICREPMQDGTRPFFDHPLASRFEENDALLVFDDVLIPWDRVFVNQHIEAGNTLYPKTGAGLTPAYQSAVRGHIKLAFAMEVCMRVAEAIGVDVFPNVQAQLGEVAREVETVRALLVAAEVEHTYNKEGEVVPGAMPIETIRVILPHVYPRAIEIMQTIGAGGLTMMPTRADMDNPELKEYAEKYYVGKTGVSSEDRIKVFKLAWDLCGEAFGQRLLQYERYWTGDPFRRLGLFYNMYKNSREHWMVDEALNSALELDKVKL